jgi:stearoyl-CoA desaturase (delta-9 desaturase)
VYEFKQKLKALWDTSKQNQTRRLERLQNWCTEAEQTGIEALEEFSRFIRGYTEIRMLPVHA